MKPIPSNPPKTLLTIAIGFFILSLLALSKANPLHQYFNGIVILICIIGLSSNALSKQIEKAWHALAKLLSKIFPPVILGLIYYIGLLPLALIARLFRATDPLKLKAGYSSTFIEVNKKFDAKSISKPW